MKRFSLILVFLAFLAGCAAAPPAEEPAVAAPAPVAEAPAAPEKKPTVEETTEKIRQERPKSLKDAREKAAEKIALLEEKRKTGGKKKKAVSESSVMKKYQDLLALPGTPEARKPEILLRLSELAYREEESALKKSFEDGSEGEILPGDRYPRSIVFYRQLADNYPKTEQALTAMYNLGYLYGEEGEIVLSARYYGKVLELSPDTPYATEIHMRMGESAFNLGQYKEAVKQYGQVLASKREEYLQKALYKLGWAHYKLDEYGAAVEVFSRILDDEKESRENLKTETLDITGRNFVEWGGVEGLKKYLAGREAGKKYGDLLYRKVGDLYMEASRHADAVATYTAAIEAYPLTTLALHMEQNVITAYLALQNAEAANARRQSWYERYRPATPWDEANGAALGQERDKMLEKGLRLAAIYRHSRAQRGEEAINASIQQYERYLELFGMNTEDGYEMANSGAQAYKEAGQFRKSADLYSKVAEAGDFTSHRENASYRRVEVLGLLFKQDPSCLDEYLAAHWRYVELNPESELVPKLLFAAGEIAFEAERFPAAREAFVKLVEEHGGNAMNADATERVARSYFRENNFPEAEEWARKVKKKKPSGETLDRALKLISFSVFKQAEEAEAAGDLNMASKHFFRLVDEFPEGEAAQIALYRAAEALRKLGKEEKAAAVYKRLADEYKTSRFAQSALTLSSEILSSLGDWSGVAENYENLYRLTPDAPDAAGYLFKAATAREKGSEDEKAIALFDEFMAKYPADGRKAEILYRQGLMLDKGGKSDKASEKYLLAWNTPAEGDAALFRAKAALVLADKELVSFRAVELKGDLEKALEMKETHLDVALEHLLNAATLPFSETLSEALFRAGEGFEQMKVALLESERPAGMTPEEEEEYKLLLEDKAFPLEERAIEFYKKGVDAARLAGIWNGWIEKIYARMENLLPWAFLRVEEASLASPPLPFPGREWEGGK
ncbi:tetratricopeptide repeat protein [bacterium]|nr:MAG: tetratricopeptide repeat protein [bacterium]